jgi:G3E family GTPase
MYDLPLDGIIVVVDAEQVRTHAENKYVGDTVLRQFTQADLIVLNKTDLVNSEALAGLHAWLGELAPGTPIIEAVGARVPVEVLLGAHERGTPVASVAEDRQPAEHGQVFQTWTLERAVPLSRQDVERFASGLGEDVYRAKGFVRLRDDPDRCYVYQQVGARWSLEAGDVWGSAVRHTRLVVIGRQGATSALALDGLLGRADWVIAPAVATAT